VLTLNLFEDFLFCTVPIRDGDVISRVMELVHEKECCILLKHGDAMIWPAEDDTTHKHAATPPPGQKSGLRVSLVYRFSNPERPKSRYASEFPYRLERP
jgi:hypothetical protein